jgi:hypothetical protein
MNDKKLKLLLAGFLCRMRHAKLRQMDSDQKSPITAAVAAASATVDRNGISTLSFLHDVPATRALSWSAVGRSDDFESKFCFPAFGVLRRPPLAARPFRIPLLTRRKPIAPLLLRLREIVGVRSASLAQS